MFPTLNFPEAKLRSRTIREREEVFDFVRKKFVLLTPEEWVRQHLLHYLVLTKNFPAALIEVEKKIRLNSTEKRIDVLVRTNTFQPLLLIECKAAAVELSQKEIDQLLRYNLVLKAKICMLTNGNRHVVFGCEGLKADFYEELPAYAEMLSDHQAHL